MWPDVEHPADPYPGAVPPVSYVHVDGVARPIYTGAVDGVPLDAWLRGYDAAPLAHRIPVLAYGSNRCPSKITWLRRALGLGADPVVVLRARTTGVAAVWAAGLRARDGARPAVLAAAPGVVEDHAVWLATPDQIAVLDRCEGRDERFRLARLRTGSVVVDGAAFGPTWLGPADGNANAARRPAADDHADPARSSGTDECADQFGSPSADGRASPDRPPGVDGRAGLFRPPGIDGHADPARPPGTDGHADPARPPAAGVLAAEPALPRAADGLRAPASSPMVEVPVERPWAYLGHAEMRRPLLVDGKPVRCAEVSQEAAMTLSGEAAATDGLNADPATGAPHPDEWPGALFAYGLLQPGQISWERVRAHATGPARPTTVAGGVFDSGHGYPAWLPDTPGVTPGVVVPVRDPVELLITLDAYEGPEYERVRAVAGGTVCWAYAWRGDRSGLVPLPDGWSGRR